MNKLGAGEVFDYNDSTVGDVLVNFFKVKTVAGAVDCIRGPAWDICMNVMHKLSGTKFVSTTKRVLPAPTEGVTIKPVVGTTIKDNQIGRRSTRIFCRKL